MNLAAKYNHLLQTRPLLTKMITSGTIGALGDVLCQGMENYFAKPSERQGYNFSRTKTFFLIGTFFVAPILHVNYSYILPYFVPAVTPIGAVKKMLIDQLVAAPIIIMMFYPAINIVEGKSLDNAIEDLKAKYVPTMIANYKIWPAANLINFMFVPIQYQVLWANFISLFFNAVLSYMHNTYKSHGEATEKKYDETKKE